MEVQDLEEKVNRIEEEQDKIKVEQESLREFVTAAITPIQIGIAEIKIMLKERLDQENLKNDLLSIDIKNHETRIKKIEDNNQWLWRTVVGGLITIAIGAIVFVVKMMK